MQTKNNYFIIKKNYGYNYHLKRIRTFPSHGKVDIHFLKRKFTFSQKNKMRFDENPNTHKFLNSLELFATKHKNLQKS